MTAGLWGAAISPAGRSSLHSEREEKALRQSEAERRNRTALLPACGDLVPAVTQGSPIPTPTVVWFYEPTEAPLSSHKMRSCYSQTKETQLMQSSSHHSLIY